MVISITTNIKGFAVDCPADATWNYKERGGCLSCSTGARLNARSDVSEKSGLHRRCVYDSLARLSELVKEKEEIALGSMPQLLKIYSESKEKQEVKVYKGIEGIKNIFEQQLEEGKEVCVFGASLMPVRLFELFFKKFDRSRKNKKLFVRLIFSEKERKIKIPFAEVRYLPFPYLSSTDTEIFGDNVALILWEKDPIGILIKSRALADNFRRYFKILWQKAKP